MRAEGSPAWASLTLLQDGCLTGINEPDDPGAHGSRTPHQY